MKSDAFQGKRKVKDGWSKSMYMVVWQVADDMPTYEVKDNGRNVKVIHLNRLLLVATVSSEATPLGASESLSDENVTRSTLAELTPLEWENEVPENGLDEAATLCLTSHVPLVWIDSILWPLPSVVLRPTTVRELGAGDGALSLSDKEVHLGLPSETSKLTLYTPESRNGGWGWNINEMGAGFTGTMPLGTLAPLAMIPCRHP